MAYPEAAPDQNHPSSGGRETSGSGPEDVSGERSPEEINDAADLAPDLGPDPAFDEGLEDDSAADSDSQLAAENGVERDMATVALDTALLKGAQIDPDRRRMANGREVVDWSTMSDAEIMLRVREGDDAGFNLLVQKYHKPIVHFMFRMVHNQAVAEELAQEVFLRVYRSRQTYRAEARFTTWLYRIATNLGVNHARDTKHERAAQNVYLDQPDPETGTTPDVADATASVEQELVRDERMRAIRQHVMALPERQRTAVLMHKYQGLDYKQIGEVLKLSESATKSLLFRAYQTLRERLKDFV